MKAKVNSMRGRQAVKTRPKVSKPSMAGLKTGFLPMNSSGGASRFGPAITSGGGRKSGGKKMY